MDTSQEVNLNSRISRIGASLWLEDPAGLKQAILGWLPTRDELDFLLQSLKKALDKSNRGRAANWLSLIALLDHDRSYEQIRRVGLMRSSKYEFRSEVLSFAVDSLIQAAPVLTLADRWIRYLRSVSALLRLAVEVRRTHLQLLKRLRQEPPMVFIKTLLAEVDFLFLTDHQSDKRLPSSELSHFTKEDLAEAFSYLYFWNLRINGARDEAFALVDAAKLISGDYLKILVQAAHIRVFIESEIMVDAFLYLCEWDASTKTFHLTAPEPRLEQSIRCGFIQHTHLDMSAFQGAVAEKAVPIQDLASRFYKATKDKFVRFKKEPIPRYVFLIPLGGPLKEFLGSEALFHNEATVAYALYRDSLTSFAKLGETRVGATLTMWDVVKVVRLFNFLREYVANALGGFIRSDLELVLQSLVPVFYAEQLRQLMGIVLEPAKVDEAIDLLCWRPDSRRVFDIQYQPLLRGEHLFAIPTSVIGTSNEIRNIQQLTGERVEPLAEEPFGQELAARLRAQRFLADAAITYSFRGMSGEIDCVAFKEGTLFLFECKNSLLPGNYHELRTSYDHLNRASQQLAQARALWADSAFRTYLFRRLNWHSEHSCKVVCCIVGGNSMFAGLRIGDSSVRSWADMRAFVTHGKLGLGIFGQETGSKVIHLRPDGELRGADLENYLLNDTFHRVMFESMQSLTLSYRFGEFALCLNTYVLNMLTFAKNFGIDITDWPESDETSITN